MKRVRVTLDAESDLDEIWLYIARDNVGAADRLLDDLASRFILIGASPAIGRARDELKSGMRSLAVGRYVIFYRGGRANISILRVVHGARDPKRIFKG